MVKPEIVILKSKTTEGLCREINMELEKGSKLKDPPGIFFDEKEKLHCAYIMKGV